MNLETVKKAKEGDVEATGKLITENTQTMYRVAFGILKMTKKSMMQYQIQQ